MMRIAAAAIVLALTVGCSDDRPSMSPSPLPGAFGTSGAPLFSIPQGDETVTTDPRLVMVDFREDSGLLNLRFAAEWDVRDVDIFCERYNVENEWRFSFREKKSATVANDFKMDDYSRRITEFGAHRCALTREDNTPDTVHIRFSNGSGSGDTGGGGGGGGGGGSSSFYSLGSAIAPYGMLGAAAVSCTGSTVTGNVGVSPGSAVTGFPGLCAHNGTITSTAVSAVAQAALATRYAQMRAAPCVALGGLTGTITPGTYCIASAVTDLAAPVVLSGAGEYIFNFSSTFTTTAGSSVQLTNGATCGGVNFTAGSSATLGLGSVTGNVLADQSVSATGTSLSGRFLALNAAVTITGSTVSNVGCN